MSLRWRLALLVVAAIVPLLIFDLGYQYSKYRADTDAVGAQTLALAHGVSLQVEQELQARIVTLQTLTASPQLQSGDLAAFRLIADQVVAGQYPGANIQLAAESGQQVMNTAFPAGAALPVRPNLISLRQAFATGNPAVSDLFQRNVGRPGVFIDVPVKRPDGIVAYVLGMNPPLDLFNEIIQRQHLPATWLVAIFDSHATTIARVPNGEWQTGQRAPPGLLALLQSGQEGVGQNLSREGIPLLTAFSHGDRFGWAVAIGVPRAELIGPVVAGAIRTLIAGGLLLAIGLVSALYAARRIASPIDSLRRLATAGDGDVPIKPAPTGLPEVDEVATALFDAEAERRRSQSTERALRDGIETMPEGFVMYDDQDRLVLCNESYRQFYPETAEALVPGIAFEEILRIGIAHRRFPAAAGREDEWIAERLRNQREVTGTIEQRLADGRWVLVTKHRLSNGWIAGLRVDITALKSAEEALQTSEQRFRQVVEAVPTAIISVGADGFIEMVNAQTEAIFGHRRADLLGQPIEMLLPDRYRSRHPDLRDGFFAAPKSRLMGMGRDLYALRKGGEEFPVEVGLSPLETEDGTKVLASIVDITSRHQAEQTRAYYAAIVESSADAIIAKDLNGVVTSWNKAAELIFGYSASEMVGEPIVRLLPSDRLEEEDTILARIRRGERIEHFETVRRRKDGTEFPVLLTVSPIFGPGGEIIGASKIARDITERLRTEESLRVSEEQLNRAQRLAQMGSDTRDLRTDTAVWSDETYRIFGIEKGTPVPSTKAFLRMVHADDRAEILRARDQLKQGINPAPFEYRITRPDGGVRHIYRESEVIKGEDGRPLYMMGTLHDVTERRRTEEQLQQAQKMEAIGNLTGGLAHDFNNLLGIIVGNLGLAEGELGDNVDLREMVAEALEAAWRGADLTRRLLAFARQQPLRPARIEVNELVNDTVRLLRRLLGEDIEVTLNLSADLWPVTADPSQLEASLANLATNARDAMLRGGRLIITTANRQLDDDYVAEHADITPGDFVMIEVSDTGLGMSPETMNRIFEPFFTTKEAGKGTGLGLSMVFGFLKQSGGHVNVYSEEGVGTTFRLYLPRATTDAVATEIIQAIVAPRGGGETVLVVEDNAAMRRVSTRQIRELGYRVVQCDRAAAALEILQREPVDLLLTDIVMPGGLDGVELAHLAKERWPALKIVLTSGFPQARVDGNGELLGTFQLLSKPYRKEELAAVLRAALGG